MPVRRRSGKRDAILKITRSTKEHPTAQWIYERLKPRFPDLSLGTVYRNMKILLEEGALASAGVVDGEERFDGMPIPHPHAVCKKCGLVIDLPESEINASLSLEIPNFIIDMRNTVFYGLCISCAETTALGR